MSPSPTPTKSGEPLLSLIRHHEEHYVTIPNESLQSHFRALNSYSCIDEGGAIVRMIRGAAMYADRHASRLESLIGEDYILGPAWLKILSGIRELLNGEIGGLDGGATDGLLLEMARAAGFSEEEVQDL